MFNTKLAKIRYRNVDDASNRDYKDCIQFDGAIEFYSRPTPVPMITKWLFLNRKLAVAGLCKKNMAQNLVPNAFLQKSFYKHEHYALAYTFMSGYYDILF